MGLLDSVRDTLGEAGPKKQETESGTQSKGAWWCMDCSERIRDVEYEGEGTPNCPSCGETMEWEGSPDGPGCAC